MNCFCVGIGIVMDQVHNFSEYESWITGERLSPQQYSKRKITSCGFKYYIERAFLGAIVDAGISVERLQQDERIGVVIGTSLGFIDQIGNDADKTMDFSWLIKKFRCKGPLYIVSNTCMSSLSAVNVAQNLLAEGQLDCCIVGGADTADKFIVNGFRSMGLLSSKKKINLRDSSHPGTVLSSAVVFLVLKKDKSVKKYEMEIISSAVSNEAFDLTRIEHDGITLQKTIQECLERGAIPIDKIDVLLTCANGIKSTDLQQDCLVRRCFKNGICVVSSVKIITGHTLGASTLLDIVSVIVFARKGKIITRDGEWIRKNAKYILILSVGFGGVIGAVLLQFQGECK